MAKTAWNIEVIKDTYHPSIVDIARQYMLESKRIMEVYGSEGDEGGPLVEIQKLSQLLQ